MAASKHIAPHAFEFFPGTARRIAKAERARCFHEALAIENAAICVHCGRRADAAHHAQTAIDDAMHRHALAQGQMERRPMTLRWEGMARFDREEGSAHCEWDRLPHWALEGHSATTHDEGMAILAAHWKADDERRPQSDIATRETVHTHNLPAWALEGQPLLDALDHPDNGGTHPLAALVIAHTPTGLCAGHAPDEGKAIGELAALDHLRHGQTVVARTVTGFVRMVPTDAPNRVLVAGALVSFAVAEQMVWAAESLHTTQAAPDPTRRPLQAILDRNPHPVEQGIEPQPAVAIAEPANAEANDDAVRFEGDGFPVCARCRGFGWVGEGHKDDPDPTHETCPVCDGDGMEPVWDEQGALDLAEEVSAFDAAARRLLRLAGHPRAEDVDANLSDAAMAMIGAHDLRKSLRERVAA